MHLGGAPSLMSFLKGHTHLGDSALLPGLFTPWGEAPAPLVPRPCAAFVASSLIQVLLFSLVESSLWGKEGTLPWGLSFELCA